MVSGDETTLLAAQLSCIIMQHSKSRTWIAVINTDLVRVEAYVAGTVIVSVGDTLSGRAKISRKREDVACTEEIEKAMLISLPEVGKKHLELLAEAMHRKKRKRPFSL